jgi:hypothetical protein
MARTMIEAGHCVKVPVIRRFGRFAPLQGAAPQSVWIGLLNEGLTPAPHCDLRDRQVTWLVANGGGTIASCDRGSGCCERFPRRRRRACGEAHVHRCQRRRRLRGRSLSDLQHPVRHDGGKQLLSFPRIPTGAVVPKGRPVRYHWRHPDKRTRLLPRTSVRRICRHRVRANWTLRLAASA